MTGAFAGAGRPRLPYRSPLFQTREQGNAACQSSALRGAGAGDLHRAGLREPQPTRATRGKPRPWPVEGGGNPRRRAARPVVDALPGPWAEPPGGRRAAPQPRPGRSRCPCPRAPRPSARRTGRTLATDRGRLWLPVWARRRRPDPRRSHRRGAAQPVETHRPPRPVLPVGPVGRSPRPHRRGEGGCRSGASGARPAQGQRGQPDHPRLRPRLRPGATGRGTTPIGRPARREPGAERTPARRRPFQRAAATPAAGLARADPRRAADARGAAARGTLRTGAAQRALAAPVGRSCRDLRRHTATAPCPAHRRRLEPAGAPPGRLALYAGERQRRADLQRALDEQRHAYRLARSNYRAGALDALELLDSQRSLVADRARLVDAEMRVAERQVELFRALGGGWQAAPSPSHQDNGQ